MATTATSIPPPPSADTAEPAAGVLYGVLAYTAWGLSPLYFKAVAQCPAVEFLAHRVVWSLLLLGLLTLARRSAGKLIGILRDRVMMRWLCISTLLIAVNWLTFIWAVAHDRVVEASLGYFMNPLINVILGAVFLGERLNRIQVISVSLAAAGVACMTARFQGLPWVALVLAASFGFYGLVRKLARADVIAGLTVETGLLGPVALAYLLWLSGKGTGSFGAHSRAFDGLLMFAGVMTSVPLLWFAAAAGRLRLSTLGILQYIAPSGQLALGVLWFGEPFTATHGLAFGLIWSGLALYTLDSLWRLNARRRQLAGATGDRT